MGATPNKKALKEVRERRGLEVSQVAAFASIAHDRLADFEQGLREPSRKQMERLAETYGVPLYALFGESIPNLPSLPKDFRKVEPAPAALSPKGIRVLLGAERVSEFSKQLSLEVGHAPVELSGGARFEKSVKRRASTLREAFDNWHLPRSAQFGFSGSFEQRFMSALRLFFEVQGGVVNVNDAPAEDFLGFYSKPDSGLPLIFVNRSISSKKAQLFTLAHEYSHMLMGQDGISNPFAPRNSIERSCNVFAAEFLAPMESFIRDVEAMPKAVYGDTVELVNAVSSQTLLSKHAAAIRLVESGHITQAKLHAWRKIFSFNPRAEKDAEKEESAGAGGVPHAKRLSELGHLPVLLAKRAVDQKLIDEFDVVDSLGLSRGIQDRAYSLAAKRFEAALK